MEGNMKTKKRIVVTGAAGVIGSALCQELVKLGHDVLALDMRKPRHDAGKFVFTKLNQRELFQPVLDGADVLCHLGEIPNASAGGLPANEVFSSNVTNTSMVLQTAADLKIPRVIYTSSCQVYGIWGLHSDPPDRVMPLKLPLTETEPVKPINAYSLSKVASEMYLKHLCDRDPSLSAAIFRFPATSDIGNDWWVRKWWERQSDEFGEGYWTYLHLGDAIRAYTLAIDHPRPGCETYHFVAKTVIGNASVVERAKRFYPKGPPLPADWPAHAAPVDCSKARDHFGWEAEFDLARFFPELREPDRQSP
jgi:UDP-glucose 4-epimerase